MSGRDDVEEAASRTLSLFHPEGRTFEVRIPKTRQRTLSGYFRSPEAAAKAVVQHDGRCEGIYFTLNPVLPDLLARSINRLAPYVERTTADSEILVRRFLPVDFDPRRPAGISSTETEHDLALARARACRDYLRDVGWPEPIVADSGNGAHLCYSLDLPNDDAARDLVKRALASLGKRFSDPAVEVDLTPFNAARVWKLYGTLACKGDSSPERRHRRSAVLEAPERLELLNREGLEALAAEALVGEPPADARGGGFDVGTWLVSHGVAVVRTQDWRLGRRFILNPCPWNPQHTNASAYVVQFPSGAIAAGCHHNGCSGKGWHDLRDRCEPGWRRAREGRRPLRPDVRADMGMAEIEVSGAGLAQLADDAWDALQRRNIPPRLFRRMAIPVRLERDEDGAPVARDLTVDRARHEVARAARFVRTRKIMGELAVEDVFPPVDVVRDMLAKAEMPLPRLERIVSVPVFAPDGALQSTPGYHVASGTYYEADSGLVSRDVPDPPTRDDVDSAVSVVRDLLSDFPFVGGAEFAHALAILLLPFARDLISGPTPLHLVEKPSPGAGATLLVDVLCYAALGRRVAAMSEGGTDEEWRKRITAKLATLPSVMLVDNVTRRVDSSSLASALTATLWEDRALGASQMLRMPVRCVWIATGNNPVLSTEIARRTVRIRLDPHDDRPWLRRGFRRPDLRTHVLQHRADFVWAAHVLVRAWLVAGRPRDPEGRRLGMFEAWSDVLGGILDVARVPGFLGNLDALYEASDEDAGAWRALTAAWWEKFAGAEVVVRDIVELCDGLIDLGAGNDQSQRVRLGKMLAQRRDRRFGCHVLLRGSQSQRAYRWRLRLEEPIW
jgi:hypothetical protein